MGSDEVFDAVPQKPFGIAQLWATARRGIGCAAYLTLRRPFVERVDWRSVWLCRGALPRASLASVVLRSAFRGRSTFPVTCCKTLRHSASSSFGFLPRSSESRHKLQHFFGRERELGLYGRCSGGLKRTCTNPQDRRPRPRLLYGRFAGAGSRVAGRLGRRLRMRVAGRRARLP